MIKNILKVVFECPLLKCRKKIHVESHGYGIILIFSSRHSDSVDSVPQ